MSCAAKEIFDEFLVCYGWPLTAAPFDDKYNTIYLCWLPFFLSLTLSIELDAFNDFNQPDIPYGSIERIRLCVLLCSKPVQTEVSLCMWMYVLATAQAGD